MQCPFTRRDPSTRPGTQYAGTFNVLLNPPAFDPVGERSTTRYRYLAASSCAAWWAPFRRTPIPWASNKMSALALLSRGETYLKDWNWVGETFEVDRASGIEIKALPNTEFTHGCRNRDATWRGHSAESCRQLYRRPEQVASLCHWLPNADANTEANGPLCIFVAVAQRALNVYADSTAADTDVNDAMIPSPVCFTSRPPLSFNVLRTISSCSRMSGMNRSSPSSCVCCVESQRSVNRITRTAESM